MERKIAGYTVRVPEPFLQKHLEEFQVALDEYLPEGRLRTAIAVYRGAVLKAAAKLGWVESLKPEEVADLRPGVVAALSEAVYEPIAEAQELPKG